MKTTIVDNKLLEDLKKDMMSPVIRAMASEMLDRRIKDAEVAENLKRLHDLTEADAVILPSGEVWAYRIHGGSYYSPVTSVEIPSNPLTDAIFEAAVKGGAKVERIVRAEQ